jgi:hypothetical protein
MLAQNRLAGESCGTVLRKLEKITTLEGWTVMKILLKGIRAFWTGLNKVNRVIGIFVPARHHLLHRRPDL